MVIFTTTSFNSKDFSSTIQKDEYIYVLANPIDGPHICINNYISDIIHYQGVEACSGYANKTAFFEEAGKEFMEAVETNRELVAKDLKLKIIYYYSKNNATQLKP